MVRRLSTCLSPRTPALPCRYGCEADPRAVATYEEMLFPPFNIVLQEDVQARAAGCGCGGGAAVSVSVHATRVYDGWGQVGVSHVVDGQGWGAQSC